MSTYKIEEIEGIGPALGEKLRSAGITHADKLLSAAATKKQRAELATATGLSEKQVLKFANMADLFRISGIGQEYSELLEASGVDTVAELAQRNAENLAEKMVEVNNSKKLTRSTPAAKEIEKWVAQAKTLPRILEY